MKKLVIKTTVAVMLLGGLVAFTAIQPEVKAANVDPGTGGR